MNAMMRQLAEVNQTFDARCKRNECAELGDPCHRTFDHRTDWETRFDVGHGLILQRSVREADLSSRWIDLIDTHLNLLTSVSISLGCFTRSYDS